MRDCGSHSCFYAVIKTGQRTNGRCKCDECPDCGKIVRPKHGFSRHYSWCAQPDWVPDLNVNTVRPIKIEEVAELIPEDASSFMAVPDPEFKR